TINLLEEPDSGSVQVFGVEYGPGLTRGGPRGSAIELSRKVRTVFQQFNLCPHLTALGNVVLALRTTKRLGRAESEERAARALKQMALLLSGAHYRAERPGRPA